MAQITIKICSMYKKLSGMTGTAKTEEEELREIYNMEVISIPTNRPVRRVDKPDLLYTSIRAKHNAVVKLIELHEKDNLSYWYGICRRFRIIIKNIDDEKFASQCLNAKQCQRS